MGNKYIHDEDNEIQPCPDCLADVERRKTELAERNPNLARALETK